LTNLRLSSPITAAGPSPIPTGFPFKPQRAPKLLRIPTSENEHRKSRRFFVVFIPRSGNRRTAHRHYQPLHAQRLGPQCKQEAGLLPFSSWSELLVPLFCDQPWSCLLSSTWHTNRLLKNAHLRRCPHPSSLRRTSMYVSLLRISGALHLGIFEQPANQQPANDITLKTRLQRVKFTA
jgi:hypothetical protein